MCVAASQKPMQASRDLPPPPGLLGVDSLVLAVPPVVPVSAALPTPVPVREPPPLLSITGPGACDIEGKGDRLGAGVPRAEGAEPPVVVVEGDVTPVCEVLPRLRRVLVVEEARGAAVLPPDPLRCACAAAGSIPTTMSAAAMVGQI